MKNRKLALILIDMLLYATISMTALLVRNDTLFSWLDCVLATAILMVCVFISRACFKVYRQVWRYASAKEYLNIILADLIGGLLYMLVSRIVFRAFGIAGIERQYLPKYIMFWQALSIVSVSCIASLSIRNLYQVLYSKAKKGNLRNWLTGDHYEEAVAGDGANKQGTEKSINKINVAIVGAGSIGSLLADELNLNRASHYKPFCFIDNDPQKIGNTISGLRVYPENGIVDRLKSLPVQEIIIALPNLNNEDKKRLYAFYKQSDCKVKIYDFPFTQEDQNRSGRRVLREFAIEDLLFREPIKISDQNSTSYYQDKVVLITGGGGSIGSELCRQIAKFHPKQLIVFDCYENNAYDIQQELKRYYGEALDLKVEISSVREAKRVNEIFAFYRPDVVVHAAAHKHVPLMEHNGAEAIKNNVFGTYNVANAAEQYGTKKFIMISTDKAVNPTNIMGASKRVCEMIVQSRKGSDTEFAAVRFGNVLGSNGSVIPLFKQQIAAGGPVTLTDKRIIRYFMTIPEAAQLVLQAGAMAKDGELFVLDMGKPIKILDLAENMIRLSGLTPYVDIDISEVGLREGEKLYEELLAKTEELDKTENELIFIERDKSPSRAEVEEKLEVLRTAAEDGSTVAVKAAMKRVVPTYQEADEVNLKAEEAEEMQGCGDQKAMGRKDTDEVAV
ncbi:MAG: nucleoside-diphosphate sugar epimerase/dehydratase [Clostridia bacterium]